MKLFGYTSRKACTGLECWKLQNRSKKSRNEHIAQSQGIIAITSGMYGLPLWLSAGKDSACNKGNVGSYPRVGKIPSPVFWPGKFHGLYSLWSRKESGTTEGLSLALTCMYMKGWSALAVWFADFFLNLLNILDKITMWRQAHVN